MWDQILSYEIMVAYPKAFLLEIVVLFFEGSNLLFLILDNPLKVCSEIVSSSDSTLQWGGAGSTPHI